MRHAFFLILFLVVALLGAIFVILSTYEAPLHTGKQRVKMKIGGMSLGQAELEQVSLDAQFSLSLTEYPHDIPSLLAQNPRNIKVGRIRLNHEGKRVVANDVIFTFQPPKEIGAWQGKWSVKEITTENLPYLLPALLGGGTFTVDRHTLILSGSVYDAQRKHSVSFTLNHNMADSKKSSVQFTAGQIPFEGGVIRLKKGTLVFSGKNRFSGVFVAEDVMLGSLLDVFMDGKITATGKVSGILPVTIRANGVPIIKNAVLSAGEGGSIMLQPGAIPASNKQLSMLGDVLKNFKYKNLDIKLHSNNNEKLSATLQVEGSNPDMYNGRIVKLNVHLGGDLLSLIQSSVMPLTDPKTLLKKGQDETP